MKIGVVTKLYYRRVVFSGTYNQESSFARKIVLKGMWKVVHTENIFLDEKVVFAKNSFLQTILKQNT